MHDVADDLLAALSATTALRAIDDGRAAARPARGGWSRKEILGHLIDSAANNHQRFVRMQQVAHLELPGYAQDDWVRVSRHGARPWLDLVSLFETYNRFLAALVRDLDPAALSHTWTAPDGRRLDLAFVARDYVAHLRHHLAQLTAP